MASILTTARLVCKDTQAREKAIDAFRKIIEYTGPNEPEVLQYVCAIPHDDNSGNEIYMIEEYALFSGYKGLQEMLTKSQICKPSSK